MKDNHYTKESSWIFVKFPDIALLFASISTFLIGNSNLSKYLPDSFSQNYLNSFFILILLAFYADSLRPYRSTLVERLNWCFVGFGTSLAIGLSLFFIPVLGFQGPFIFFSAAVQFLIIMKHVGTGTFPIALFFWSSSLLIFSLNQHRLPPYLFMALLYPLNIIESKLRQQYPQKMSTIQSVITASIFLIILVILRLIVIH